MNHELPDTLPTNDTGKSLTESEVYALTVNSVVGITTEATTNVFGQQAVSANAGTGFILSEDGYIITNQHVVEGADTIKVALYNGESYDAELVGGDSSYDIAVLKIEAEGLQAVSVGNSDEMLIEVELSDLFTDDYSALQRLTKEITRQLKDELLLTPRIRLVAKGSLPTGDGKAVRVKDLRKLC